MKCHDRVSGGCGVPNQALVSTAAAREVDRYGLKNEKTKRRGVCVSTQTIPSIVTSKMCPRVPVSAPIVAFTFATEGTSEGKYRPAFAQILVGRLQDFGRKYDSVDPPRHRNETRLTLFHFASKHIPSDQPHSLLVAAEG